MDRKAEPVTGRQLQDVESAVSKRDFDRVTSSIDAMPSGQVVELLERLSVRDRALVYRMLPKDRASVVFERLDAPLQKELVVGLQDEDVAAIFAGLTPDDRARLVDELPATVATRLLRDLPDDERELTSVVLGYPERSIGRRMNPECVTTHPHLTAGESLQRIRHGLQRAETIYTIPVTDDSRKLVGVVGLRQVMGADPETPVAELMSEADSATATEPAEEAARRCAGLRLLAMPVVDHEDRLVGILTVDDALDILENAESEDQARISGSEPLRRPYLSTPVRTLVQARVVWLLVLAIGATLTVQVLEVFESTLEQMVVLSVFIPLLIGTGGNTGNQAATSITRALALGDVRPRDVAKVALRELRVGVSLGLLLGAAGFVIAGIIYGASIGAVIGLTLAAICTLAATVGGLMPLIARAIKVDPAVFSNPFISTFVDATGLVVYFFIARAILGLG